MNKDFVEELRWRGMLHSMTPGTEEQLKKEMTVGYLGIDPTADSLHIGPQNLRLFKNKINSESEGFSIGKMSQNLS